MSTDETAVGGELPAREVSVPLRQLVRYAGASGDFYPLHYDLDFARSLGYDERPVQGLLKMALLDRLVRDWLPAGARLRALEVSYRGLDLRDEPMTLGGTVTAVDERSVTLELWVDSAAGARTTTGSAEIDVAPDLDGGSPAG
ncbi:MAG: MaoC/PaaZ C-terminal domain-containing protein [Streptosporangiales bacterium]